MELPWHGANLVWSYPGTELPWHGATLAWSYPGMELPWHGANLSALKALIRTVHKY